MKVKKIIIHHSAGDDKDGLDWADIKEYHKKVRGWDDVGYHAGVERIGSRVQVVYGRSWWRSGAHCVGQNSIALGFCFVGNYNRSGPDEEMLKEAARFLSEWVRLYGLKVEDIKAHREYADTDCPGKAFDLERLREEVRVWMEEGR